MGRVSRFRLVILPSLLLILVGALFLGVACGGVKVPLTHIILILIHKIPFIKDLIMPNWLGTHETIILTLRLPRVLLAGMVGSGLALAGATFQGLFRNPMADPFVIGVSSGAALGAVCAMLLQSALHLIIPFAIPAIAFIFAVVTVFLVYELARTGAKVPVMTLLLAGVAVSSLLSALVSLAMFLSGNQLHQVLFWLMGGFSGRGWDYVYMFIPYGVLGAAVVMVYARELNAMLMGEEPAQHLGIEVEKVKRRLLIAAALLTGACVSVSGLIGFVGLIVPHIVRMLVGPDHRILLPAVVVVGAFCLVFADVIARVIIAPEELPVGIVTALIGAPFFIYLLRRQKKTMF